MEKCKMLNYNQTKYLKSIKLNEKIFKELGNKFYFENSLGKIVSSTPSSALDYLSLCVECGAYGKSPIELIFPKYEDVAAVWTCNPKNFDALREVCQKQEKGLLKFLLKNGKSKAFVGIFKNLNGTECVGFAILNKPQTMNFAFSRQGFTSYEKACKEEGTLPYLVETGKILELIPEDILALCGIDSSSNILQKKAKEREK